MNCKNTSVATFSGYRKTCPVCRCKIKYNTAMIDNGRKSTKWETRRCEYPLIQENADVLRDLRCCEAAFLDMCTRCETIFS